MCTNYKLEDYRPCVGITLFNSKGRVFLGHRMRGAPPYVWQMPQGGIDKHEDPMQAALRELWEETGVKTCMVKPLGWINDWLFYDFPHAFRQSKKAHEKRGQRQLWFAFRFIGEDHQIDLEADPPTEFSDWQWSTLEEAVNLIVPFKREVYEQIREHFTRFETLA